MTIYTLSLLSLLLLSFIFFSRHTHNVYKLFFLFVIPLSSQSIQELQQMKSEYEKFQKGQTQLQLPTGVDGGVDPTTGLPRQAQITPYQPIEIVDVMEAGLKHFGYDCQGCGMNFEKTYGEVGKNFIHVHHIIPISKRVGSYEVDPAKDLIPLCPNCHGIVHRRKDPYTIDELKLFLTR